MKLRNENRGAALSEYVLLLGLIGVVALWSVSELGAKIVGVMDDTTEALESVEYAAVGGGADEDSLDEGLEEVIEEEEVDEGPQRTFTWKGDGTDELPSYVTKSGSYWIIDMDPLIAGIVDRNDATQMAKLTINAQVSQAGTFQERAPGLNSVSMTVDPRIRWIVPGTTKPLTNKIATESFPESEILAYNAVTGQDVPDNATGIRIQQYNSCTPNARCQLGEFFLNVEFYLKP